MRNNVRKKMRLKCLLFAMVLLAGVPAAAKDRKNQKAAAENVVKKEMVCKTNGTIYQWKNDSWRIKKKTIRTKKEFKKFQTVLKKKQEKGLRKMLKKQYAGTNFRKKSIVLVPQLLSPYMNYKYKAMVTKFDAKGKLVGEIQIERSGNMDKPGVSYPAIVKTYVMVVRVPKAQEAMILRAAALAASAGRMRRAVLSGRSGRFHRLHTARRRGRAAALPRRGHGAGSGAVFPGFQRAAASTVGLLDRCGSVLSASLCAPAAAGQNFFAKSRPAPEKTLSFLV